MKPQLKNQRYKLNQKPKVLLAMSGGVDSSVAALLLQKQGYEVTGAFMKNWSDTKNQITGECQWREERRIAAEIASILGIKLITLDFEKQYKSLVVDEMFKLYKKGITPNPDIDCNQKIKFPLLWKEAKAHGFDLVATGHYARVKRTFNNKVITDKKYVELITNKSNINNKKISTNEMSSKFNPLTFNLLRGKDESKDQSYFLYRLSQEDLSHTLFPIGELTKTKIREIAEKNKFPNYNKKGTVGICFIGKINLKDFLKKKIKPKKGKILDPNGDLIGEHDGIYYYTIGQKIGPKFGIDIQKTYDNKKQIRKWYVAKKDVKKNIIIAAPEGHELNYRKNIILKNSHWIAENPIKSNSNSIKVLSRIRQVGELLPSKLVYNKKSKHFQITLNKPITGVSEGQAIVLYKKDVVLGGGVISF